MPALFCQPAWWTATATEGRHGAAVDDGGGQRDWCVAALTIIQEATE